MFIPWHVDSSQSVYYIFYIVVTWLAIYRSTAGIGLSTWHCSRRIKPCLPSIPGILQTWLSSKECTFTLSPHGFLSNYLVASYRGCLCMWLLAAWWLNLVWGQQIGSKHLFANIKVVFQALVDFSVNTCFLCPLRTLVQRSSLVWLVLRIVWFLSQARA